MKLHKLGSFGGGLKSRANVETPSNGTFSLGVGCNLGSHLNLPALAAHSSTPLVLTALLRATLQVVGNSWDEVM